MKDSQAVGYIAYERNLLVFKLVLYRLIIEPTEGCDWNNNKNTPPYTWDIQYLSIYIISVDKSYDP